MVDVLRRISAPAMAGILAFSVAGSQARAGSGAREQFVYLQDWRCDVERLGQHTLETDANTRPSVSVGEGALAITYQTNESDEDSPPIFSTVIFDSSILQKGIVGDPTAMPTRLTFFSEDCDEHVPPAERDLYR